MDTTVLTGVDDVGDQAWLDARITDVESGIEAVLDIARNWTQDRSLSRLHPGVSAQEYILSNVKHPLGRGVVLRSPLRSSDQARMRSRQRAAQVRLQQRTLPAGSRAVKEGRRLRPGP